VKTGVGVLHKHSTLSSAGRGSKAELREMLVEAVRYTQPQAGAPLPDALKEIAAEVGLPHTQEESRQQSATNLAPKAAIRP
jgi:hypothetical protein